MVQTHTREEEFRRSAGSKKRHQENPLRILRDCELSTRPGKRSTHQLVADRYRQGAFPHVLQGSLGGEKIELAICTSALYTQGKLRCA